MMYRGRLDRFRAIVYETGFAGQWHDFGDLQQFHVVNGAILNWWMKTGAIYFQGDYLSAIEFEIAFWERRRSHRRRGRRAK